MALVGIIFTFAFLALTSTSGAFAEYPTPFNEWDFDIQEVSVFQDPINPEILRLSVPIEYKGGWDTGIANLDIKVTDKNGRESTFFGQTRILEVGDVQEMRFKKIIDVDGVYTVEAKLWSPSIEYKGHVFQEDDAFLTVPYNGYLIKYGTIGEVKDKITSYYLSDLSQIKYDQVVHAKVNLPETHNFEKIALVNGNKVIKEYPTDVTDIYIQSDSHDYSSMNVKVVEYGNLLPLVDAQDTAQEYVVFYAMDKVDCEGKVCMSIDPYDIPFEFEWWMLIVVAGIVGAVANLFYRNKMYLISQYRICEKNLKLR